MMLMCAVCVQVLSMSVDASNLPRRYTRVREGGTCADLSAAVGAPVMSYLPMLAQGVPVATLRCTEFVCRVLPVGMNSFLQTNKL